MLKIRLSRGGRKKLPFYRILVTNVTSPRDSKFLEKVGTYNPLLARDDEKRITVNKERIEYWLSVGAQPTEKVAKFFIALGIKGAEKYPPTYVAKEKGDGLKKKALEKLEQAKEAAVEAEATKKAEAEAKIVEDNAAKEAAAAEKEAAAAAPVEAPAPVEVPVAEEAPAPAEKAKEEPKAE